MTMPVSHLACEVTSSARAQRGRLSVTRLTVLLCLADLGIIDAGAVAQEFAEERGRRTAMGLTVLTLEEEKAKAAKPASEFRECASGCPIMIVIPAGKFIMGSPDAARAGANTRYSWGDDPRVGTANCDGCGSPWDLKHTASVGSLKPNAFGLHDMHGNVWEWVEDTWHQNYDGAPTDGSAWLRGGELNYRVIRGGSWRNESEHVRAPVRFKRNVNVQFDTLGLRVARTIKP